MTTVIAGMVIITIIVALVLRSIVKMDARAKGNPELARAARLLDEVRATDDAIPALPTGLRQRINVFLNDYYREIEA